MDKNTVIEVNQVSKKFCKSLSYILKYGFIDIGKSILGLSGSGKLREREFWALNDISFEIKKGETLGIVGSNGSGKSTFLKLLNGIFMPDKGKVTVKGKVGALIAVGAGFHPMLTGRENIYINGTILGMSKKEIDKKFDEIVEFADIGDFLDTPVKNYSSGMYVRLGFSVAIHAETDILLVDEILSIGDESFRKKSFKKIAEISDKGTTIIFVSHNMGQIKSLCDKAVWLEKVIKKIGKPDVVVNEYLKSQNTNEKN